MMKRAWVLVEITRLDAFHVDHIFKLYCHNASKEKENREMRYFYMAYFNSCSNKNT